MKSEIVFLTLAFIAGLAFSVIVRKYLQLRKSKVLPVLQTSTESEQSCKSSLQLIRTLRPWGDSIPLASFIIDTQCRVLWSNSNSRKLFSSFKKNDLALLCKGLSPAWIHPHDTANAIDLYSCLQSLKKGTVESRLRIRSEDGDWIWLQIKLTHLASAEGQRSKCTPNQQLLLGTCEDVTLFQTAIHALRDRESRAKRLLSGIRDAAVLILCEDGFIQFSNDAVSAVLGYTEDELRGQHFSILCPKTELLSGKLLKALTHADSRSFHEEITRRVRKSGQGFWANVLVSYLPSEISNTKNYCVVIRDVSNYKREQKELHEWKKRFEQLSENVKEAFWIYDVRAASLIYISPVVKPLLNIEPTAGDLFFSEVLRHVHPSDSTIARNFISDLTLGHDSSIEFRIVKPDSQIRWLSFKSFAVRDSASRVHRIIGVAEDVTETRNSQNALKEAKEAADAANKAKSEFLANMSHEIRTPLGAIMGFAELVGNFQNSEEERQSALQAILRNGRQLSKIIDEILDLSKVEAGKLEIEEEEIELFPFVNDVTTLLGLQAKEKGIGLKIERNGRLPSKIRTDGTKFRQILINVAGNAVKFTDRGSVTIEISAQLHPYHSILYVRVTDTGLGLIKEQQERIFKPFVQADSSTRRRFGGTGLGLILSRRLAQLLGGGLKLAWSEEGRGSCFEISINIGPSDKLEISETEEDCQNESKMRRIQKVIPRLDGTRILVVDDAPDNRLIVQKFLSHAGASVDYAEDGRTAAKLALEEEFDLIVMDIQMPEFDGYETISYIRRRGYTNPVIALSAHAMREDRERSISFGFNEHLSKPIDRKELLGTIRRLIQ
jgi:PAS domain S-box-containing protein